MDDADAPPLVAHLEDEGARQRAEPSRSSGAAAATAVSRSAATIAFERSTTPSATYAGYPQPQPALPSDTASTSTLPAVAVWRATASFTSRHHEGSAFKKLKSPLKMISAFSASARRSSAASASRLPYSPPTIYAVLHRTTLLSRSSAAPVRYVTAARPATIRDRCTARRRRRRAAAASHRPR